MNKMFGVVAVTGILVASQASAIVRPGWERPIMKADRLFKVEGAAFPEAKELTMHRRDGAPDQYATMFTLVEDTGIRCIQAPCPSTSTSRFRVISAVTYRNGGSRGYRAVEILPPVVPHGPVGHLARVLELTDHSTNGLQHFSPNWIVRIQAYGQTQKYEANAEPVYTIQYHSEVLE